jgi:hypothetical protein
VLCRFSISIVRVCVRFRPGLRIAVCCHSAPLLRPERCCGALVALVSASLTPSFSARMVFMRPEFARNVGAGISGEADAGS